MGENLAEKMAERTAGKRAALSADSRVCWRGSWKESRWAARTVDSKVFLLVVSSVELKERSWVFPMVWSSAGRTDCRSVCCWVVLRECRTVDSMAVQMEMTRKDEWSAVPSGVRKVLRTVGWSAACSAMKTAGKMDYL